MSTVTFEDFALTVDPVAIYKANGVEAHMSEDGTALLDENGAQLAVEGLLVEASFAPDDAQMSDNAEAGVVAGNIISFIYVDDHYRYTVRSKSEEDYIVNDEDLWNQGDYVSVMVPEDKISYEIIEEQ